MNRKLTVLSASATTLLSLMSICATASEKLICPKCKNVVTDAFCTNCGAPAPEGNKVTQSDETIVPDGGDAERTAQTYYMPYPMGMFRGFAEVLFSPVNIIRGSIGGTLEVVNKGGKPNAITVGVATCIMGPFGAVGGCFPMIGDICIGAADMLTLGAVGNETDIWKDGVSSPNVFERCWIKAESHGQKSAYFYFVK